MRLVKITALAWRLLSAGGRRGMLGSILTLASVTVVTALLLFAVSANQAFADRGERTTWRLPQEATSQATAIEATRTDHVEDTAFTRVDLAATGTGTAPIPPGMDHFPKPGEVWVSPALAQLMDALPDRELANRFPSKPSGELGADALVHDDDLVAVVGYSPDDPVMTTERFGPEAVSPIEISGFDSGQVSDIYRFYQGLMALATVLMVVPVLVFGGAAARLTVARRDQRLASLRLIGATPGQVVGLTVVEAVITAVIGAVLGTACYLAAVPAIAQIPIDGGGWYLSDLWPGLLWTAGVIVAVPLLVGVSAVVGLRRIVVSPLGVARRQTPPGLRAIRLILLPVLMIAFIAVSSGLFGGLGGVGAVILLVLLGGVFLAVNYLGPWVVALIGRITAAQARTAATLLAGRRLVDDPRSAWRTVAGIALTGFIAGFMGMLSPSALQSDSPNTTLRMTVVSEEVDDLAEQVEALLPEGADVKQAKGFQDETVLDVTIPGRDSAVETLRTELAALTPGHTVTADDDDLAESNQVFADIQTGVLVVLTASMFIAMVSAAVSGASSVLDRRQTYALMHLSGTPMATLNTARRKETLIPLVIMGGGSIGVGVVMALPFMNPTSLADGGAWTLLATVVGGAIAILGASSLSRPLLRSVMVNAAPRPD